MTDEALAAKKRIDDALEALRIGLAPYVSGRMKKCYGNNWLHYASRSEGASAGAPLDVYGLLKTMIAEWGDVFRHDSRLRKARSFIFLALEARNTTSHFIGLMTDREALRFLDAMRELLDAMGASAQVKILDQLYEAQKGATQKSAPEPAAEPAAAAGYLDIEPPTPDKLKPWRLVAQPHPDVLEARFTDAEFAAQLAAVDRGIGSEEYVDPRAFFRITYLTKGLSAVLSSTIERFAGKGGQPVIGLQTNFGGGKTHTLLALYHLAGAHAAGHNPAELSGLKPIFAELGIESLPEVRRAVFVGTDKGPSEAMYAADGREIRTLWGYLAHQLVGWDGVDAIAESERNRTNPGAEKMAAIMAAAAPCLILLDEVVAYAKQLQGTEQAAFHAFVQSLTEAAATVPGAVVVGSLPASRIEVGDELGVQALLRLEKLFGRIQSAWSAASELETFEIVRRRLFQPLDEEGEKVRDDTVAAFHKMYRDNPADFPPDVREAGYREQMRRAYPIHPEILKRFSEDWSTLPKFQRTRGVLKIMAHVVYSLWRSESPSPLITLGLMPVAESRVRSALLEPLDAAYDAIVQSEVDGELSVPAKIEAQRPRIGAVRGATRATRTVFLATAPHQGAVRGAISGAAIKLGAAQPGDQLSMFGEVLSTLSERAAYLYRDADRYWFSTQPTLNKLAEGGPGLGYSR